MNARREKLNGFQLFLGRYICGIVSEKFVYMFDACF